MTATLLKRAREAEMQASMLPSGRDAAVVWELAQIVVGLSREVMGLERELAALVAALGDQAEHLI